MTSPIAYDVSTTVSFVVQNLSTRSVKAFGTRILPGASLDLMDIPGVTEDDIRAMLIKGFLKTLIANGTLKVLSSTLDESKDTETLASLGNLDDNSLADQTERRVLTVLQTFQLNKTSTATVDGITCLATKSGTGRWLRVLSPVAKWTNQTTWYVDSVDGDDENVGSTSGTALKTVAEFTRRLREVKYSTSFSTYTMNLLNDVGLYDATAGKYTDSFQWDFSLATDGYLNQDQDSGITRSLLQINGQKTTVSTGITKDAYTSITFDNAKSTVQRTTGEFAVGDIIEFTGGPANGKRCYVLAVESNEAANDTAVVNPWTLEGAIPTDGYGFNVVTLTKWGPQIGGYGTQGNHRIQIDNVELPGLSAPYASPDGVPTTPQDGDGCPDYELSGFVVRFRNVLSRISVTGGIAGRVRWGHNSSNTSAIIKPATGYNSIQNSFMTIERGDIIANYMSFVNCIVDVMNIRGILTLSRSCFVNGCIRMGLQGAASVSQTEAGPTFVRLDRVSFFDFPATVAKNPFVDGSGDQGAALIMKRGAAAQVRKLVGSSNDGYGLDISEGSFLLLQDWAANPCTVTGGEGDLTIDGGAAIPIINALGVPTDGYVVTDWTGAGTGTLAGGTLGGNAMNLVNGTRIVTVA